MRAKFRIITKQESGELSKDSLYKVLNQKGYDDIAIVGSRLMHYSLNKAASILGMGTDNIVFIDSNKDGNLDLHLLKEKIHECKRNKLYILALVGIAGTTETGEIDPLREMGEIAQEFGIHFHVDGAWGGATMFSDKHKEKLKGIEQADSITICGHKQLYLPQGISVCLFKDPQLLNAATTTARYQAQPDTFDVGRFTIEGSRSAISLCLHGALHIIGKKGYEILINNGIEKAQYFSRLIGQLEPFELIMKPALNIVNYRYLPEDLRAKARQKSLSADDIQRIDRLNTQIQQRQFEQGLTFVSKTTLKDNKYNREIVVFRAVLSNPNTTASDLQTVLEDQLRIAHQIETRSKDRADGVNNLPIQGIGSDDLETAIVQRGAIHLQLTDDLKADLEEYLQKNTISIGKPIDNTQIYILDKHACLVPPGVVGELCVGGDGLAQGYLNLPELTQEKFISNPFNQDNGKNNQAEERKLYRTGDLARYLPDGNIEYLGRIDHQVKIRGFRIELGEIEAVLNTHPQIQQGVVIAREDIPGNKSLVAYIVTREESIATNQLREFLSCQLPEYMVPNIFVSLDALPLTPNGKVDRKALPAPEEKIALEQEYVAPRTPNEEMIAKIFSSVLGGSKVGIYDNFFKLGGHSLLATQLISRLRVAWKIEIPLRAIFESPTVAQLEPKIKQLRTTESGLNLPPIQPRSDGEQVPLSWGQERLWFLARLEESSATYNMSGAIRLSGQLDLNALQQALSEIVRRHEVLRTSFSTVNGQPIQVIHPEATLKIKVVDLQQLEVRERETELQQQVQQEASIPFNLERSPLLRCSWLQLDTRESVLLLTMHHIVSDGWSIGILIQELSSLYSAFCAGKSSPLPELAIQYGDFALWQRQWLSGEVLETQLDYWQQQLQCAPELLQLPTDRPRPLEQTYRGATQSFTLAAELSQKLQAWSGESGSTLFMTLLAGFATLLYRYSGQTDIVIGSPIANRNRSEIESLIGFFVNTLVLRSNLADNPSIQELLAQVRETTLKAYEHQDVPFEKLVEVLQPQRSLSHSPLFQVMFVLQNTPMEEMELAGVTLTQLERKSTVAQFDLTLSVTETEAGLEGFWEYNTDLFEGSTIERMSKHFQTLLEAIANNPQQRVSELPLLTQPERHQLLVEWNETERNYPKDKCLHQLFEEQVEKTPDAVAVVFEEQQLTYRELNNRANQLAHYLKSLGVKPETLVGICIERSVEMVVGLLGILKAGGAYVPLDPHYPQERLSYMLADSRVEVLLSQSSLLPSLPEHQAKVVCLDTDWSLIEPYSLNNLEVEVSQKNLAYVIYTSGSTGKPKGVMNAHQGIVNRLLWMQNTYQLTSSDRIVQKTPFSFDVSVWEFFWPLLTGARIVVAKPEGHKDSNYLVDLIVRQQITTIHFVPPMLQVFLQEPQLEKCSCLKRVIASGEALPWELTQRFFSQLECELHNLYGPTEAAIDVTYWQCQPQEKLQLVPIGRPIANTQIYLLDQNLQPVPIGVAGELHIGGDGLARGYLNRSELTKEKFIPNPFASSLSQRLYKTGDLARYLPDGNIEYLGRIDHQVKIRGFRIELGEIEAVLGNYPQIQQGVVIAREDIPGSKSLVAYIVTRGESLSTNQLREFLSSKLPEYMVPNIFVSLDTLPLTPNGKVDRKALPAPEGKIALEQEYVAPRTPNEEMIVKIFSSVLGVSKVGIYDNFFEIGGHSLLATQVVSRLREAFQIDLPLRSLFERATVAQLAEYITTTSQVVEQISRSPIPEARGRKKIEL
ncbi:MAG: amino acid adenylation domain-containing protein [Pleurocapsa sp. CRU_1_2]|nr:amino acid adenylation domain-containing protein [Pleurocapsa sp. CRU_1_2]